VSKNPKKPPRRGSISSKLAALVLAPLALATLGVTLVSGVLEANRQAVSEARGLQATGAVLAASAAEAAAAGDRAGAFRALRSIAQIEAVTYARIVRSDGTVLAETGGGARLRKDATVQSGEKAPFWTLLLSRSIETSAPILYANKPVGEVVLLSTTNGLLSGLFFNFLATLLGVAIAALLGLAVAWRMQGRISGPVIGLTRR
jgi:hypothetical protein